MESWNVIAPRLKAAVVWFFTAGLGAAGGVWATTADYWTKDRELDIEMLQIALGILREDPEKSKIAAARGWAVDVINASAPVKIPADARAELIKQRLILPISTFKMGGTSYYLGGGKLDPSISAEAQAILESALRLREQQRKIDPTKKTE